jgi:hypothetical protein
MIWVTIQRGIIFPTTNEFTLDMYVNLDSASMWHQQHSALYDNVLSRIG